MRLGAVALDGTRMGTDASIAANRTLAEFEAEVATMLADADAVDAAEDVREDDALQLGLADRGDRPSGKSKTPEERGASLGAGSPPRKPNGSSSPRLTTCSSSGDTAPPPPDSLTGRLTTARRVRRPTGVDRLGVST